MSPRLTAIHVAHDSGAEVHSHVHELGQLVLALSGTVRIHDHGGWHLATAGNAIWIAAGCRHRASYPQPCELLLAQLEVPAEAGMPDGCALLPLSNLACELLREAARPSGRSDKASALIHGLLLMQLQRGTPALTTALHVPEGRDRSVRTITRYLRQHVASHETLGSLATRTACSERTLARRFEADTGLSFRAWRERLRIVSAVEYLIQGKPLVAVAQAVGYASASSFSTAFRRLIGMPPGLYLKQFRR